MSIDKNKPLYFKKGDMVRLVKTDNVRDKQFINKLFEIQETCQSDEYIHQKVISIDNRRSQPLLRPTDMVLANRIKNLDLI